jgi:elongator complex protein 3
MVKIYPNTVIKSAELYEWFRDGRYTPYGDKALFAALMDMKRSTPCYCRISRLIRDIPSDEIEAGNIITNLREALAHEMKKRNEQCVCLRCREIGRQQKNIPANTVPELFIDTYETDGGTEYFLSFEDPKRIAVFGFLRLRLPEKNESDQLGIYLPEIHGHAFVRELHTYGNMVAIGKKNEQATQHKGLGKRLVYEAERIAQKHGYQKLAVISGVGVRDYYRKLGYKKKGTYMVKEIQSS